MAFQQLGADTVTGEITGKVADWLNDTMVAVVSERAIAVKDYGTLGTSDDTATIEAALAAASGRRLVFPQNTTLQTSGVDAPALTDAVIEGNGTTLVLAGTGSRVGGLKFTGDLSNVTVERLGVLGNGEVTDHHAGVYCQSGIGLRGVKVRDCDIEDTTLGISFNADGSGVADGVEITGNRLRNIVGTDAGDGYGIHASFSGTGPTGLLIHGNDIGSAQRHSIYVAKGSGIVVSGNRIRDHRDAALTGSVFAAITILRSAEVSVLGNIVKDSAGGALALGGHPDGGVYAGPYTVHGNVFTNPKDGSPLVLIGQQAPSVDGFPQGVIFEGNILRSDTAAALMRIWAGKDMQFSHNYFEILGSGNTEAIRLDGSEETANNYLDNVSFDGNLFHLDPANATGKRAFRFNSGHETDTTRYWFSHNRRIGGAAMFIVSASVTNPNITVEDQAVDGLTSWAPTAGVVNGPTTTTAPSAGAGGALPATPAGYLTVNVNGTDRKIAYY